MKPPLNRDELAKLVEEALDGGGYLMFRFGHGQIRQLRPDETEVVLAALKTPAPEAERMNAILEELAADADHSQAFALSHNLHDVGLKTLGRRIRALKVSPPQSSGS